MKKRIVVLTALIVFSITSLLLVSSCDSNFLARQPFDSISGSSIWTSDETATMAVNGIYHYFAREAWFELYSYIANLGPLGYTRIRAYYGITHYTGNATPDYGRFMSTWEDFYTVIRYSNDVIANIPGNENITDALGKRLVGQAQFMRGLSYFYLWALYGGVPLLKKPLPPSETYLPRSSAEETRQFIIQNFQNAIDNLPVSYTSSDQGWATKGAAIAMLGKMYLYVEQWSEAADQFQKLMNPPFQYRLADNFTDNFFAPTEDNPEKIFDVQYIQTDGYGSLMDNRYGYRNHGVYYGEDYSTASNIFLKIAINKDGSQIDMSTIPERDNFNSETTYGTALMNWYQTTFANADPRFRASVILPGDIFHDSNGIEKLYWPSDRNGEYPGIRTTWWNIGQKATIPIRKMVSEGTTCTLNRDCPLNFPLIRYAEVLLMYAEAKNEASGPSPEVYNAVNEVRNRVGVANLPRGLSKAEMRRQIRLETFRELAFETQPYFNVIRWRTAHTNDPIFGLNHEFYDFRFMEIMADKVFEEYMYRWPIPREAMDINPELEQNPGW